MNNPTKPSDLEVTGSILTVGAFFRSPPETPSTGSSKPGNGLESISNKPWAFYAIELKQDYWKAIDVPYRLQHCQKFHHCQIIFFNLLP
ncbi:hypothetical protein DPMN_027174 [Dreissena polymorpha]|uniref:Uncharacterized protein n=1 Tax=Dreissena polymorpha TaxID=45954 RepID=A0A9D4LUQ6_DREPO|nr:hypothetical protein DPMN_027174 [Dreissena polymorpha]